MDPGQREVVPPCVLAGRRAQVERRLALEYANGLDARDLADLIRRQPRLEPAA